MIGKLDKDLEKKAAKLGVFLKKGYLHITDGRVRIYSKTFPGTSKSGYCLRSRIVWWVNTGEILKGCKFNLHHKNHNRSDDRFSNLKKISHREHALLHNKAYPLKKRICKNCKKIFGIKGWRLNDPIRGKFCSKKCRNTIKASSSTKRKISEGLKRAYMEGRR